MKSIIEFLLTLCEKRVDSLVLEIVTVDVVLKPIKMLFVVSTKHVNFSYFQIG